MWLDAVAGRGASRAEQARRLKRPAMFRVGCEFMARLSFWLEEAGKSVLGAGADPPVSKALGQERPLARGQREVAFFGRGEKALRRLRLAAAQGDLARVE